MHSSDAADKLHFEQRFSHLLVCYFVLSALHLLILDLFSVSFFMLYWLDTPKTNHCHCCKTFFIIAFFNVICCFHPVLDGPQHVLRHPSNILLKFDRWAGLPPFSRMMFQSLFCNEYGKIFPKKWMCQLLQDRPSISPTSQTIGPTWPGHGRRQPRPKFP